MWETASKEQLIAEIERLQFDGHQGPESLIQYKQALDAHSIVASTDPSGKITYVNDKFCKISKYRRDELLGKDHRILNSRTHSKSFFSKMWQTILSGQTWQGDIRNRASDGSHYWVHTSITPFYESLGNISQFVAIRTDITEKVLAEERISRSKERLSKVTDQLKAERTALNNKNIALNELISHLESEKDKIKSTINSNVETVLMPLIDQVSSHLRAGDQHYLNLIKSSLIEIAQPLTQSPDQLLRNLTPKEIQICHHIKQGLSVKEIAQLMHLSPRTIDKHRENIRGKLGLKAKKINLMSFLRGVR